MYLLLIILTHLVLLSNFQFTLWPEMIVYPYLINNGFSLYTDIINPYPPLLPILLANFAKLFGYQPQPYQIFTWILILVIDLLIFTVTKKLFKSSKLSLVATSFFVVLSLPFGINGLWFDLVQTPLIIIGVYFFYQFLENKKSLSNLILGSLLLAVAFSLKQQSIWLIVALFSLMFVKFYTKPKDLIIKSLIVGVPFILTLLLEILLFRNSFEDFFFWTIYFPIFKASQMPGYILLPTTKQLLIVTALILVTSPLISRRNTPSNFWFFITLVLILFAYPRFDYFHLVPALSIISLAFPTNIKAFSKSSKVVKIISVTSLVVLIVFSAHFFQKKPQGQIRFFEKEIFHTSSLLEKVTSPKDLVYIQNGPDQILALSRRLPPKPWADEFPWYLEINNLQDKIVESLISQKPRYTIFKPYIQGDKYELGVYRPQKIADFLDVSFVNLAPISDLFYLKVSVLQ